MKVYDSRVARAKTSAASAQIKETLQSPSHAEANNRAQNSADRFASGAGRHTSSAKRVANECHPQHPDPNPKFHHLQPARAQLIALEDLRSYILLQLAAEDLALLYQRRAFKYADRFVIPF